MYAYQKRRKTKVIVGKINKNYICRSCWREFTEIVDASTAEKAHFRFCPECREKNIKISLQKAKQRKMEKKQEKRKDQAKLSDIDIECKKRGISYGKYVYLSSIGRLPDRKETVILPERVMVEDPEEKIS